jgi:hypothetical protein
MTCNPNIGIDHLLRNGCPSIRYRTRAEILSANKEDEEMRLLQRDLLQDPLVQDVIHRAQPDGWLGSSFHGTDGIETGIRILREKGVESSSPVLVNALKALENAGDRLYLGMGKPGKILDQFNLGGSQMIRAYLFAIAGVEDPPFVREQIDLALEAFRSVQTTHSREEMVEPWKGKLVLRSGLVWPSLYHLRLLAWTHHWRTPENLAAVASSVARLIELSPLPAYHVRYKGQLIAPASFCMLDFRHDLSSPDASRWMMEFHRLELLARLGMIHLIPELVQQVTTLNRLLEANNGLFTQKIDHPYFRNWGAYTGMMLEKDWRIPERRINDLTFRCLLIGHFSRNPPLIEMDALKQVQ